MTSAESTALQLFSRSCGKPALTLRIPEFAPDQRSVLLAEAGAFSTQLIFAMAKAKLYRELDQRSRTDGLTGLSRRGPFEERLREEVARAESFKSTGIGESIDKEALTGSGLSPVCRVRH